MIAVLVGALTDLAQVTDPDYLAEIELAVLSAIGADA